MAEPRVSKIQKSIRRVFNVGKYESLEVQVSFEETVDWKDLEERQKKSNNITKLLISDFEKTRQEVFDGSKLEEKKSTTKSNIKEDANESMDSLGLDDLK